jgi:hypothetical protein
MKSQNLAKARLLVDDPEWERLPSTIKQGLGAG